MNPWVYVGLGSNMGDSRQHLEEGLKEIQAHLAEADFSSAKIIQTPPLGGPAQADYLNTVCRFRCAYSSKKTLSMLFEIENIHGRRRDVHWGPRTLDLDLLLYGNLLVNSEGLQLPHPGIRSRGFVLIPMLELAPDLTDPQSGLPYANDLKILTQNEMIAI